MRAARCNARYLPAQAFPDQLTVTADVAQAHAVAAAGLAVLGTPMAGLRATLAALPAGTRALWLCKGFESGTGLLGHEIARATRPDLPCGVLSGPSFAQEVALGLPAALTVAAHDADFARRMARDLHRPRLRLYSSDDLIGVEVGGAVKNVIAIAAGISDGLGFGLNARAALMTRGLAEMTRLGLHLGARPETFMGLSGMGDLILTCTGDLSRNRRVGLQLAGGESLEGVLRGLQHVAEGVTTAREVARLANELGIDMPITQTVQRILGQEISAREAVQGLLNRDLRDERT